MSARRAPRARAASQEVEEPPGLVLVDAAEGEADVHQDEVAHLDVAQVVQADALADPAEVDAAHQDVVLLDDLKHPAGNG